MGGEPYWLHVAGQIAGTVLLIELMVLLLVMLAFTVVLYLGARWVRTHLVPLVDQAGDQTQKALTAASRGGDRIVQGVADIHGRQEALKAAIWTFVLGPRAGREATSAPLPSAGGERLPPGVMPQDGFAPGELPGS
jgi:hypothetical protein